jgi:hypothetical protein
MTPNDGGRGCVAGAVWGEHPLDFAQEVDGGASQCYSRTNPTNAVETVTKTAGFYMCSFYGIGSSGYI